MTLEIRRIIEPSESKPAPAPGTGYVDGGWTGPDGTGRTTVAASSHRHGPGPPRADQGERETGRTRRQLRRQANYLR